MTVDKLIVKDCNVLSEEDMRRILSLVAIEFVVPVYSKSASHSGTAIVYLLHE